MVRDVAVRKALASIAVLLVLAVLLADGCIGHPKGIDSLRWLTDAEKERVIEIALDTPEAAGAREAYGYYEASLRWVAINWCFHHATDLYGLDYECVEEGIPENIPESAELYSRVDIEFGEPPRELIRVAVNPDTGKVAYVESYGLKKVPTVP
jgi:hypothetical protein